MGKNFIWQIVSAAIFLLLPVIAFAFSGKVIKVADGDTITVLTPDYQQVRVRLYGIDCPERKQPYGAVATRFVRERVAGKEVEVTGYGKDRYGRTIGIVGDLNEALISAGLAWVYPRYCKIPVCQKWKRLQDYARDTRRGLWQDSHSLPPWDWRRNKRRQAQEME